MKKYVIYPEQVTCFYIWMSILNRNSNPVKNLLPFEFPFWSVHGNISANGALIRGYTAPTRK